MRYILNIINPIYIVFCVIIRIIIPWFSKHTQYKHKKHTLKTINVKGRDFKIESYYEGVVRFNFNELCDQNLGADDYLEIIKNCKFIIIDQIPQFDNTNSNQQQRFITLIDIIYDKNIPISVTSNQSLNKFTSSRLLKKPFKRTISRLYELTSIDNN